MSSTGADVLIIGAGAAGLAALNELHGAGLRVLCIEARDRIGGRVHTIHDPLCPIPIELGAEFIHGRSPEIWDLIRGAGLAAYDCGETAIHIKDGKPQGEEDAWLLSGRVMNDMKRVASEGGDITFASFLEQSSHPENAKRLAASYVEGFNAADQRVIGIASLAQDARAAEEIHGDRSFRNRNGYESVIHALVRGLDHLSSNLMLNATVENIEWGPGSATLQVRSGLSGRVERLQCRRAVVTVPLGVLQVDPSAPGAIRFDPEPVEVLAAARKLRFGQVMRLVLRFSEIFWEKLDGLADAGFLLSEEQFFPTWWTPLPFRAPVLTGWSAGPHAAHLLNQPRSTVIEYALNDLARITNVSVERLTSLVECAYFHDWHGDPFSRGAYSYVPAGALPARAALAEPVANTLFFAGEATELHGHSATVHGAIATGKRAAHQILKDRQ